MRLGLISDTHGSLMGWKKAQEMFAGVDAILHAGDILYHGPKNPLPEGYDPGGLAKTLNGLEEPLLVARGNCDSQVDAMVLSSPVLSPYLFCVLEGYRIMIQHGHVLAEEDLPALMQRYHLQLLLIGHTHIPVIQRVGPGLVVNPGSPALGKGEQQMTAGLFQDGEVKIWDLATGAVLLEEGL